MILSFLLFMQFNSIAFGKGNGGELLMPKWFWDMEDYLSRDVNWAVGYSLPHRDSGSAYKDAVHDGSWRLYRDAKCTVKGESGISGTPDGDMHIGSTLHITGIDSMGFKSFIETIYVIDSVSTPNIRVVLLSTSQIDIDRSLCLPPENDFRPHPSKLDGNSIVETYHFHASSWIEAERMARIQLALNAYSEVTGLDDRLNVFSGERELINNRARISQTGTNVILDRVNTIARRVDKQNQIYKLWVTGSANPAD